MRSRALPLQTIGLLLLFIGLSCQSQNPPAPAAAETRADGVVVPIADGFVKLQVCDDKIIRVLYAKEPAFFDRKTLATEPKRTENVKWSSQTSGETTTVRTASLQARVDRQTGAVTFLDPSGQPILAEKQRSL